MKFSIIPSKIIVLFWFTLSSGSLFCSCISIPLTTTSRIAVLISTYVINIYSFKCFKLNADKLKSAPGALKKLSDGIEKEAVKKDVFAELVKNVNAIDSNKQNLKEKLKIVIRRHLILANLSKHKKSID